ncbi:MAG: hypothetical protein ACRC8O_12920, partial [Plesiomonas shigelloides]
FFSPPIFISCRFSACRLAGVIGGCFYPYWQGYRFAARMIFIKAMSRDVALWECTGGSGACEKNTLSGRLT